MSMGHCNSNSKKEETEVSGISESQAYSVWDRNLVEDCFHLARLLLLLKSTRTQVIQIWATSLHGAYRDNWHSQCSTAPSSPLSWSCAFSQDPHSSSPLPSAACNPAGRPFFLCSLHIWRMHAELAFQEWFYFRVYYTHAVNPLHSGGCVPHVLLCTQRAVDWMCRRWDFSVSAEQSCVYAQTGLCGCVQFSLSGSSFRGGLRLLICRTRAFSKTLVKQFWSQKEKALPIYSTNSELWWESLHREKAERTKPVLKCESTWVHVSIIDIASVLSW